VYLVRTQEHPLPGRCDQAMSFEGMGTQFECQGEAGHLAPFCRFEDRGIKVYWRPDGRDA
jgi:hypothetical protein